MHAKLLKNEIESILCSSYAKILIVLTNIKRRSEVKRTLISGFVIFLVLCLSGIASAEPYKSKKFPPINIIKKAYSKDHSSVKIFDIAGKYKNADGHYIVYVYLKSENDKNGYFSSQPIVLIKLDTDYWIFQSYNSRARLLKTKD